MTTSTATAPTAGSGDGKPADTPPANQPASTPEPTAKAPDRLPDDHPLVTAFTSVKTELAETKDKLKTFEDATKSDIERATAAATAEKARADQAEARAERLAAAVKYGLTEADLELLEGVPADQVADRAKKLAERIGDRKKQGNVVPKEGSTPNATPADERQFVRELFGSG